jgi:hypothetical protein
MSLVVKNVIVSEYDEGPHVWFSGYIRDVRTHLLRCYVVDSHVHIDFRPIHRDSNISIAIASSL